MEADIRLGHFLVFNSACNTGDSLLQRLVALGIKKKYACDVGLPPRSPAMSPHNNITSKAGRYQA